jgi:hypothetical protein
MIFLDTNNLDQVDSARVIEVNLGTPNRKMMIFSGIARPEWAINDDGHSYQMSITVNLRRTVLAVEQATVTIGLASVGNDDSTFLFATDSAGLDIDKTSQELLLNVAAALRGENTTLNRFGYQVVTVVTTQTTGISGTIRWSRDVFDASHLGPGQIAQMFKIAANHVERIQPPDGFVYEQYTPLAFGVTTGFSSDKNDFLVPYEIPGAPYNQPLVVTVDVGPLFAGGGQTLADHTSGPNPVVLTLAQPGVTGVDFRVTTRKVR